MNQVYTELRRAGAPFIASTDAGIPGIAHHRLPEALALFARLAELRPVEALRSAPRRKRRARSGSRPRPAGSRRASPRTCWSSTATRCEDLTALLRPILVVARGRVVFRS